MKKLRSNLKKEEIALSKGYRKWFRVVDNEIRLFINEKERNDDKKLISKIYWKENRAELCIGNLEGGQKFYEDHKHLDVKFFVKADIETIYSEYEVLGWNFNGNGVQVKLGESTH